VFVGGLEVRHTLSLDQNIFEVANDFAGTYVKSYSDLSFADGRFAAGELGVEHHSSPFAVAAATFDESSCKWHWHSYHQTGLPHHPHCLLCHLYCAQIARGDVGDDGSGGGWCCYCYCYCYFHCYRSCCQHLRPRPPLHHHLRLKEDRFRHHRRPRRC